MKVLYSTNDCHVTFSEEALIYMRDNAHKYGLSSILEDNKIKFIKDDKEVILPRHHPIFYDVVNELGYHKSRGKYSHFDFIDINEDYFIYNDNRGYEHILTKSELEKMCFSLSKDVYTKKEFFDKILQ